MTQKIYDNQDFFQVTPNLVVQLMDWMVLQSGRLFAKSYHLYLGKNHGL